jgi:hypothetical protein
MSAVPDSVTLPTPDARQRQPQDRRRSWLSVRGLWDRWKNAEEFVVPPRSQWPVALRRARLIGLCLLGIQFLGLCWWSNLLANRYALTQDFAIFAQAAHLIGAGHIDPYSTVLGQAFWRDHSFFMMWPLALIQSLWPRTVTLLWLQDAVTVGMEATALAWICDIAASMAVRGRTALAPAALVALGVVLLVSDPWMLWASSWDFHTEAFSALCAVATARNLYLGRKRAWLWALLTLSTGDVGASYLTAVGVSAALSGRHRLRSGGGVALLGVAWFAFISAVHGATGSHANFYAQILTGSKNGVVRPHESSLNVLSAAIGHPTRALTALWANRVDLWANLSPGGVMGLLWTPVLAPLALVLAESQLVSYVDISYPGFQNIIVVPLVTVGTVALLASLLSGHSWRRVRTWLASLLVAVLMLNAIVWSVIWIPQAAGRWLTVTPGAASTLRRVATRIAPGDEVVASQGIVGGFADREYVYDLGATTNAPAHTPRAWVIFAPTQGIELAAPDATYADIASFARRPGVRLFAASHGIWAFEWNVPPATRSLALGAPRSSETPGWTVAGGAGEAVENGPQADWYTAGTSSPGYVVDQAYWREQAGTYSAEVTISTSQTANVEIWNATTSTLLSRQSVPDTNGKTTVQTTFSLASTPPEHIFSGFGPWSTDVAEPAGDQIEIRVWSPGGNDIVDVYRVGLRKL